MKMTRLSCHPFRSNEVRLWLSVLAYNLGNLWRAVPLGPGAAENEALPGFPCPEEAELAPFLGYRSRSG